MAIGRITYPDKVDYRQEGQDDRYKITAENMNEIKKTFNDSAEGIEKAMNDVEQDIKKSEELRTNLTKQANDMQVQLTASIGKAGKYKIEDGKLYLTDANGSFGEGIELPAQSSVFIDGVVQGTLNLNTTRDSSANKVAVQLLDANGNALMTETLASQVYTKDGLTMQSLLNEAVFVLEESNGVTHCGDYERYIKFLADQQKEKDENKEVTV